MLAVEMALRRQEERAKVGEVKINPRIDELNRARVKGDGFGGSGRDDASEAAIVF